MYGRESRVESVFDRAACRMNLYTYWDVRRDGENNSAVWVDRAQFSLSLSLSPASLELVLQSTFHKFTIVNIFFAYLMLAVPLTLTAQDTKSVNLLRTEISSGPPTCKFAHTAKLCETWVILQILQTSTFSGSDRKTPLQLSFFF